MMGTENFVENVQRETKDRLSADERWEIFLQSVDGFSEDFSQRVEWFYRWMRESHCDIAKKSPALEDLSNFRGWGCLLV